MRFPCKQDHAWRTAAATLNVSCGSGHAAIAFLPADRGHGRSHGNPESGNRFDSVNSAIS
jgi:hypothetical protein